MELHCAEEEDIPDFETHAMLYRRVHFLLDLVFSWDSFQSKTCSIVRCSAKNKKIKDELFIGGMWRMRSGVSA